MTRKWYKYHWTGLAGLVVLIMLSLFLPSRSGELHEGRDLHTAILLQDGRVLVMGGVTHVSGAETYNQMVDMLKNTSWSWFDSLEHEMEIKPILTCEIFDPKTEAWTRTAELHGPKMMGSAYLLSNGQVFYGGGYTNIDADIDTYKCLSSSEIYDPKLQKWTPYPITVEIGASVIAQLSDDQILKLQTIDDNGVQAWIFDLNTLNWSLHPEYNFPEGFEDPPHSFFLPSEDLVVEALSNQLYNPKLRKWEEIKSEYGLWLHSDVVLKDGRLIEAGGLANENGSKEVFILDVKAREWKPLPPLEEARGGASMTVLPSGKVLVAGGTTKTCELYDPVSNSWSFTGSLHELRTSHTATLLPDGRVLVVGGGYSGFGPDNSSIGAIRSCELYDPTTGLWKEL